MDPHSNLRGVYIKKIFGKNWVFMYKQIYYGKDYKIN